MNHATESKTVQVIAPAAIVDNTDAVTTVIDRLGYSHCKITVTLGATDIAMSALKVQESDVKASATALTGGVDVAGLVFGTSNTIAGVASTLPDSTADNNVYIFDIDCRARKRYLDLVATPGDGSAGTYISATAELSRPEQTPRTAAQRGAAQVLRA